MEGIGQISHRLERIEKQLDDVRQAMVQMARTEERVSIVLEQNSQLFKKSSDLQDRVSNLETKNAVQGQSLGVFERVGWIVAATSAAIVSWKFK